MLVDMRGTEGMKFVSGLFDSHKLIYLLRADTLVPMLSKKQNAITFWA